MADVRLLTEEPAGGLLSRSEVEHLIRENEDGRGDRSMQIWSLLCLDEWRQQAS